MVQYYQGRVMNISDLERRLEETGYDVGVRVLELLSYREKQGKRENRLIGILQVCKPLCCKQSDGNCSVHSQQFVSTNVWKALFGKVADSLEKSTDNDDECAIAALTLTLMKLMWACGPPVRACFEQI